MTRTATVPPGRRLSEVQAYMPGNYSASANADGSITIAGSDNAGWTLDGYVIPRLASGMIFAREVTDPHAQAQAAFEAITSAHPQTDTRTPSQVAAGSLRASR